MTNIERVIRQGILSVVRNEGVPAKLGRADGTIRFTDDAGTTHRIYKWVRYQRGVEMVEAVAYDSVGVPEHPDYPVRIAHRDGNIMIISKDGRAADTFSGGRNTLPNHSHDRFSYNPHYTTGPSFLPLMAIPSSPPALTVEVQSGWYRYRGDLKHFDKADSSDLSGYRPAAGLNHFIVLCLNRDTNALAIVDGNDAAQAVGAVPFTANDVDDVTIPATHMPLAAIRLYNGQTEILPPDIFMDLRLWGGEVVGDRNTLFVATADVTVADTVTETTLVGTGEGSITIPADRLDAGRRIIVKAGGHLSDTGTPTLEIKITIGGTEVATTGAMTLNGTITEAGWWLEVIITCRSAGASGTVVASGLFEYDDGTQHDLVKTSTTTIDTTGTNDVDVTAAWGTADTSNTVTLQTLVVALEHVD